MSGNPWHLPDRDAWSVGLVAKRHAEAANVSPFAFRYWSAVARSATLAEQRFVYGRPKYVVMDAPDVLPADVDAAADVCADLSLIAEDIRHGRHVRALFASLAADLERAHRGTPL